MGLSSSKTTSTSGPSKEALPYLTSASSAVQNAYNQNQANNQAIGNNLFNAYNQYSGNMGSDLTGARNYSQDVLSGKYLTQQNPYLSGMIDQTNSDVMDRVNALFSQAGQTGSSRQIGELGKQLSNSENALRYQNYSDEMNRMSDAAQLGLGLNQATNANEATLGALGTTAAQVPYIGANDLAANLGNLWGNAQTTTQKQSGGLLGSLLGAGAQLGSAAIMASERRVKKDIRKIGSEPDGLGRYEYRYVGEGGDHPLRVGVMADEVAALRPWALGPVIDGIQTVDYAKLGGF